MSMRRIVLLSLLATVLIGCCLTSASKSNLNGAPLTHQGDPSFWARSDFPIVVYLDDSVSPETGHEVLRAVSAWNQAVGLSVFISEEEYYQSSFFDRPKGFVIISQADHLPEQESGKTVYGDHVGYFHTGTSRRQFSSVRILTQSDRDMLLAVIVHEFGHVLCLGHDTEDVRSVMYPVLRFSTPYMFIMPDDVLYVRRMMLETGSSIYDPDIVPGLVFVSSLTGGS